MTATLQPALETATTALYRAALGPVNIDRYLPVFARFDESGSASPGWNWAAALLTLNWLVFRQLWGAALVYVAAVEGLALLVLGLGSEWLAWPSLAEWGFLGATFVLSCLVPGVYGNAWLHADARRRMTRAVRDAKTVRGACDRLARRASTRKRLVSLVVINVLLAAAALGAYWGLARWAVDQPTPSVVEMPRLSTQAEPAPPATPRPTPAMGPAEPLPDPTPVHAAEPPIVEPPPAVVAAPLIAPATTPAVPAPLEGFAINVGLFADAANADRVHTRLLDAGLSAYIQVVDFPNGQRTRVRVGPFANRALADEAAARIKALGLDAVVFRQ